MPNKFKDIINQITGTDSQGNITPLANYISTLDKLLDINDAIIRQAEVDVPKSGTDIDPLYIEPINPDGSPGDPTGLQVDMTQMTVDSSLNFAATQATTPDTTVPSYGGGDGIPPNGWPAAARTSFPPNPTIGDFVLRTDYTPNRLFRFNGTRWVKIEDNVRTDLTPGPNNRTQRSIFVNNTQTFVDDEGRTQPVRQSLSKALTPKADN